MTIPLLYLTLVVTCWAYALIYGGRTARWAFVYFLLATIGTVAATNFHPSVAVSGLEPWHQVNWLLWTSDFSYFLAISILALRSRRYWPIWSAGFQLACVLTHFGPWLDHMSNPRIYRALSTVWAVPMLVTMALGIAKDRRVERHGHSTIDDGSKHR